MIVRKRIKEIKKLKQKINVCNIKIIKKKLTFN